MKQRYTRTLRTPKVESIQDYLKWLRINRKRLYSEYKKAFPSLGFGNFSREQFNKQN